MRALCKKSKFIGESAIHNGQLYEINKSSYGSYFIKINNKRNYAFGNSSYLEYFYSPEETTNILRTKLIDEMTK